MVKLVLSSPLLSQDKGTVMVWLQKCMSLLLFYYLSVSSTFCYYVGSCRKYIGLICLRKTAHMYCSSVRKKKHVWISRFLKEVRSLDRPCSLWSELSPPYDSGGKVVNCLKRMDKHWLEHPWNLCYDKMVYTHV